MHLRAAQRGHVTWTTPEMSWEKPRLSSSLLSFNSYATQPLQWNFFEERRHWPLQWQQKWENKERKTWKKTISYKYTWHITINSQTDHQQSITITALNNYFYISDGIIRRFPIVLVYQNRLNTKATYLRRHLWATALVWARHVAYELRWSSIGRAIEKPLNRALQISFITAIHLEAVAPAAINNGSAGVIKRPWGGKVFHFYCTPIQKGQCCIWRKQNSLE